MEVTIKIVREGWNDLILINNIHNKDEIYLTIENATTLININNIKVALSMLEQLNYRNQ